MTIQDKWADGDAYERYVGRWSRQVARKFLGWLSVGPGKRWLDIGCGTGAITQTILGEAAPERVTGVDPSTGFIATAIKRAVDPRATFQVGDAQDLPFDAALFDAVVSGLMLNFVPQYAVAAREMYRVAAPGAVVAAYVWDYAERMEFMRYFWDAAVALDPAAEALNEGPRFPICNPQALSELFTDVGLANVETRGIEIPTLFRDFDDYWSPFLGGQGPAPAYVMSLPEETRGALRERLRATLPTQDDGSISLVARVWAVRGIRE